MIPLTKGLPPLAIDCLKNRTGFSFLKSFFLGVICLLAYSLNAQQNSPDSSHLTHLNFDTGRTLIVKNIGVYGNKKTKKKIILREMQLHIGDTIISEKLNNELETAREFIYNTTLFEKVTVLPHLLNDNELDIIITVKEKWYTYPVPYLELADRSFNEWVHTYNADLKRLSYGIRFWNYNFSGKRDEISLDVINGFRRNISLNYSMPYLNAGLTTGLKVGGGFSEIKEIPYTTDKENHLMYYENGGYEKKEWNVKGTFIFRKKLKKSEAFSVKLRHITISDSILLKYNPGFFNSPSSTQTFADLEYLLNYDDADNIVYPKQGNSFSLSIKKRGLGFTKGINLFSIQPSFNKYFKHNHEWYSSIRLTGEIKLPFSQPYYNVKALGYDENYIRGLEYFVIDGVAWGLGKFDLKKKIMHFEIPTFFKSRILQKVPFTIYAKTYSDIGYAYSRFNSRLNNKFLYGGGVGLDILTLYDFNVSIEYSFNQLGQKGLFLHR